MTVTVMLRSGWRSLAPLRSRVLVRAYSSLAEATEVCFIDPALVVEPVRLKELKASSSEGNIQPYIQLSLPVNIAQGLGKGVFTLGDRDDPESHWVFGKRGEVFQYKYAGSHIVQSGFVSAVAAQTLHQVESGASIDEQEAPQQWLALAEQIDSGSGPPAPFLFAGRVVDCASVGIYQLVEGGTVTGVMISSEYDTAGAD